MPCAIEKLQTAVRTSENKLIDDCCNPYLGVCKLSPLNTLRFDPLAVSYSLYGRRTDTEKHCFFLTSGYPVGHG